MDQGEEERKTSEWLKLAHLSNAKMQIFSGERERRVALLIALDLFNFLFYKTHLSFLQQHKGGIFKE